MSYILEALKKAQAERQLGNAPTIHAPAQTYAAPPARAGKGRYLVVGLGIGVALAAAVFVWQRQAESPPVEVASAPAAAPVPAPAPVAPPPVAAAAPAPAPAKAEPPAPIVEKKPAPRPVPAPEPVAKAPPAPEPAAPPPAPQPANDDNLPTLQQLPDALQREIPRVSFGGYIYSPTPGESLLLVDKALRREGEQVAPGLVLERLMAKAAVMNYRGTRYRVAY